MAAWRCVRRASCFPTPYSARIRGSTIRRLMESEENMKPFPPLPTVLGNLAKKTRDYHIPTAQRLLLIFGQFYFVPAESFQLCSNRKCRRSLEMSWFRPLE